MRQGLRTNTPRVLIQSEGMLSVMQLFTGPQEWQQSKAHGLTPNHSSSLAASLGSADGSTARLLQQADAITAPNSAVTSVVKIPLQVWGVAITPPTMRIPNCQLHMYIDGYPL